MQCGRLRCTAPDRFRRQAFQDLRRLWRREGGPDSTDSTWEANLERGARANWDQHTANADTATAGSYAAAGFGDDAQMYAEDAASQEATAQDSSTEAGQYGDPIGPDADTPTAEAEAPAEEAPVERGSRGGYGSGGSAG